MAVVLFTSTLVSAAPAVEFEEYGRASDCVRYWRNAVLTLAANNGADANTDMLTPNMSYLDAYMIGYTNCVNGD